MKNISIALALAFLCIGSTHAQVEVNETEATPTVIADGFAGFSPESGDAEVAPEDQALEKSAAGGMSAMSGGAGGDGGSGALGGAAGSGGGRFNFQTDLSTGRFTYSIPIVVAPGRQGAQPTLALGYNSASGNSWCGVGWSLDVGFIQREVRKGVPVKWALPSETPLTQYDDAKGFIANFAGVGSTLVLVSATDQNPIIYRQEVETAFLTYKLYNDNHWEVVDKSGNTFYFGEGSTNRMENPKSGWTAGAISSTFRWALNKVVDVNGNQTFLSYGKDGGVLYLTNIAYNANLNSPALAATHSVEFVLTNRPDTNITFQAGYRTEVRQRLAEIRVKAAGNNVRKYVLGYTNSPSTTRSLLATVTEYGSDYTTALPSVKFNYQVKPFEFAAESDWGTLNSQGHTYAVWNSPQWRDSLWMHVARIDIDGDGLVDRVMRSNSTTTASCLVVQRNTGSGFASTNYPWPIPSTPAGVEDAPERRDVFDGIPGTTLDLFDINGDSLPDRVISRSPPYTNFSVSINPGTMSPGFAT